MNPAEAVILFAGVPAAVGSLGVLGLKTARLLVRLDTVLGLLIEAFSPSDPDTLPLPEQVAAIDERLADLETLSAASLGNGTP